MNGGRRLSREEVIDLCRGLGYDPDLVTAIVIHPRYVELTLYVPIESLASDSD